MKILMIGDVVGTQGVRVISERLQAIRAKHQIDFVIANVENIAGGAGIHPDGVADLLAAGVDVMTSGNHAFDKKEILDVFGKEPRLLRPANYPEGVPGTGFWLGEHPSGVSLLVLNLMGRHNMPRTDCQFRKADALLRDYSNRADVIVVDHHAEASSEKIALGRYLDGRVSAVVGTHTHVTTADEQILPGGTAYMTDLGMTGSHAGVIGMAYDSVLERFLTGVNTRLRSAEGDVRLNGAIIDVDTNSRQARSIARLNLRHF
ncbi:MAG: TIGR00282 family metallophosphoesterase [Blastocatellia bacterium]|nr:TIGR00282 family metallophosphoesterase [Blastocatellia bacterium]